MDSGISPVVCVLILQDDLPFGSMAVADIGWLTYDVQRCVLGRAPLGTSRFGVCTDDPALP